MRASAERSSTTASTTSEGSNGSNNTSSSTGDSTFANVGTATAGRALASLTLSPGAHTLLRVAGFRSVRDVMGVKALDLAMELQADPRLILSQLEEIKTCLNGSSPTLSTPPNAQPRATNR
jgi:hypothetical protein